MAEHDLDKLNIHSSREIIARHGLTLPELFNFCLEFYKEEKHQFHLTYEQKNQLAAYWRQSTLGPYHPDKLNPGYFDFVGNDRKNAWQALGEISSNGAMAGFCNLLETSCPSLVPWIRHKKREKLKLEQELMKKKEDELRQLHEEEAESQKLINIVKRAEALQIDSQINSTENDEDSEEDMPVLEKNIRNVSERTPMQSIPKESIQTSDFNDDAVSEKETAISDPKSSNGEAMQQSNPEMDNTLAQHFTCIMYLKSLRESGHVITPEQERYIEQMKNFVLAYYSQPGVSVTPNQSNILDELQKLSSNSNDPNPSNKFSEIIENGVTQSQEKDDINVKEIENGVLNGYASQNNEVCQSLCEADSEVNEQESSLLNENSTEEVTDVDVKEWTSVGVELFIGEVSKEPDSILTVGRGETVTVRIPTYESGNALYWEFATQDYDIGFGASFESQDVPENNEEVACHRDAILPILRRSSHEKVITGSHSYPRSGTYLLFFDNSYSLLRSKTVYYRVFYTR